MTVNAMSLKFKVYVKPPQSGKTKDAIIEPMRRSIREGRIPVIIIPSRIQLQKQLTSRVMENLDIERIIHTYSLDEKCIGRFDTGNTTNRLPGSKKAVAGIEDGTLQAFIVLNNIQGMTKLLCTMLQTKRKFDIIVDEVHSFFNVGKVKKEDIEHDIEKGTRRFWEDFGEAKKDGKGAPDKKIKLDNVTTIGILFELIKKNNHTFSGTTATVSFIAQSPILDILNLEPKCIMLDVPQCYEGYESIRKKTYNGTYGNAIHEIISLNPVGTTTMCHVGHTQASHYEAASVWIDTCLQNNVDKSKILSIVDNSDGYTLYNWCKNVKVYEKSKTSEPWKLVSFYRNKCGFTHIGIFGDRCMSESNTYQKCNDGINCPINDLVVMPFIHNIANMTIMIQKIGRIFGNDTIGGNVRTLWFPISEGKKSYQERLEEGIRLDGLMQREVTLRDIDFKKLVRIVTRPKHTALKFVDIKARLLSYSTATTKIAKFVRSLASDKDYSEEAILVLLGDSGYTSPSAMLNSFCQEDNFGMYLLKKVGSRYSMLDSIALYHHLVYKVNINN
jgi:hypothetical protein